MRPASTSKKPAIRERGRRPKGCSKARQPMWLCLTSCCRTRGRARPVSIREYRSLDLSTHIFAITSPPGGVHIFACPGSFRNFAPKPCIFSLTTPVRTRHTCARRSGRGTVTGDCALGGDWCAGAPLWLVWTPHHGLCPHFSFSHTHYHF